MIEAHELTKRYDDKTAVDGINQPRLGVGSDRLKDPGFRGG